MKVTCILKSLDYDRLEPITTCELDVSIFGASLDNPFPCSELFTFSAVDSSLRVVYQVSEAVGA